MSRRAKRLTRLSMRVTTVHLRYHVNKPLNRCRPRTPRPPRSDDNHYFILASYIILKDVCRDAFFHFVLFMQENTWFFPPRAFEIARTICRLLVITERTNVLAEKSSYLLCPFAKLLSADLLYYILFNKAHLNWQLTPRFNVISSPFYTNIVRYMCTNFRTKHFIVLIK